MARYYSDDGVFEASLDEVWKLIDAHGDDTIRHVHPSTIEQRTLERGASHAVRDVTMPGPDGKPAVTRIRFRYARPHTQTLEFLSGPLAGSWETTTYVPDGPRRTRLVTVGEIRMAGAPDEVALAAFGGFVDGAHEEDQAFLKRLSG